MKISGYGHLYALWIIMIDLNCEVEASTLIDETFCPLLISILYDDNY